MKNKNSKVWVSLAFAAMLFAPVISRADGINFNGRVEDDDEVHFHFRSPNHGHPQIWAAAAKLREAKHLIWSAMSENGFGGHRVVALNHINIALDELRRALEAANRR